MRYKNGKYAKRSLNSDIPLQQLKDMKTIGVYNVKIFIDNIEETILDESPWCTSRQKELLKISVIQ